MNETEDTTQSGDWTVEPPRKTGRGRKALRLALIVAAAAGAAVGVALMCYCYDAYCMKKYAFFYGEATASGTWRCSRCGKTREIGYIYAGGPLPKPRPFALKSLKEAYEQKRSHIEYMQKGRFDHECVDQGEVIHRAIRGDDI